ncbi:MAG: GNAT family N-acetyltransferase [Tenericutes bacterium]|nr:GNAT family N-acetyltransferase [Mycoplasmatota bacterium]
MYIEYWDKLRIKALSSQEKCDWFDVYNNGLLEDRGYSQKKLSIEEVLEINKKIKNEYFEYLESLVEDSNFQFYTVLKDDSKKIVSLSRLIKRDQVIYIAGLETHRDFRRIGYAKQVLQATIKKAFEEAYESIHSVVRNWNIASIKTHESLGFKVSENKGDNLVYSLNNINQIIKPIFEEFLDTKILSLRLLNERTQLDDIRFNYEIITESAKYVGKLHSNSFTKVNRLFETAKLINIYNDTGYFTPKYIVSIRFGIAHNYNIFGRIYCLWVEEYKSHLTISEVLIKDANALKKIEKLKMTQVPEYIGKIASFTKNLNYDTYGPYRLFQAFDTSSSVDEYEEYLSKAYNLLMNDIQIDMTTLQKVYKGFFKLRKHIKKRYSDLPYAVFQSDLQDDNVLIDEDYNFVGLIDFNLAGREKVITYLINELAYQELESIHKFWVDDIYINRYLDIFKEQLRIFQKFYQFNDLEKELFTDLYKAIIPFKFYPLTEIIGHFKLGNIEEVNFRLKWMEKILELDIQFF